MEKTTSSERRKNEIIEKIERLEIRTQKLREDVRQIHRAADEIMGMTFDVRNILNGLKERWEELMECE